MSKRVRWCGQGLFAAAFVVALGFGARDAVAGVGPVQASDEYCESKCWNKYRVCQQYGLGDCDRGLETCLNNCAM
jgi:hypothetical protein